MANQLASASTLPPSRMYDVFLSFRGKDTRFTFTDYLYQALDRYGIHTFIDRLLIRGEKISPAFVKAIEESRISIIVISRNYALSRWCLDELVHILKCRKSRQQIVWPIFYMVDPSHVRNQTDSFGDAFARLEGKYKDEERILLWRSALEEVANLSGYTVKEGEYEATFINNIVKDVLAEVLPRTHLNVAKHLVGIQSRAEEVEEILGVGGNGRCVVGIWGTSGIGKTTIAKAVYNAIAHNFEGSYFLADVRETSTSREGIIQLQNTIFSKVLPRTKLKVVDVHEGINLMKKLLRKKKILLILDDVDRLEQLNNFVEVDWLGEASRVIITTKDRGLLESYGVKLIYNVQKLEDDKAIELLALNAFGRKEPLDDYLSLARRAIAYAQGLPLALTLIGSHLRNKSVDRWQAILDSYDSYQGEPYRGIQRILRKSYDAWDYVLQQVFLDIACFFKGEDKDYVLQILRSLKLNVPQDCIEVLVENAIITIEDNRILMHDLLEKMGKHIVREESPTEPGKRSRLWHHEDVYHVLTENKGTRKIKGIIVKLPKPDVIPLNAKSFLRMVNLEIFINHNACFSGCVDYLPNDLRWIELSKKKLEKFGSYIFEKPILQKHMVTFNLQSNYHPRHLVTFDMQSSGIRQLKGFKNLAKLTSINLSCCEFLEKIPNLSGCPNIKNLNLSQCKSLVEVDDSIGLLDKLVKVILSGCSKLTRFVTRLGCRSLKYLLLEGCTRLESLPKIEEDTMESLWSLDIGKTSIRELPSTILKLHCLYLGGSILTEIDLLVHPNYWSTLLELDLSGNSFVSLPDCISKCVKLRMLTLDSCKRLREIPQVLPPILTYLHLCDCTSLEKLPSKLPLMLEFLNLTNCFRLSGDEVEKLENNLLNQESLRWSGLEVLLTGNEVPKWFSYTSNHPTTIEHLPEDDDEELFVGGSEFSFEIPLNLQVGETLLGLALSCVLDQTTILFTDFCILINRKIKKGLHSIGASITWATDVWVGLVDLDEQEQHGDICQVIFRFREGVCIKSCGVQLLLRNQHERLPLSSGTTSSLGKRPRPHASSDIVDDEYDEQRQWLSLSSEPTNDYLKRRQIDLNVPIDIVDDEYDEQQQWLSLSSEPTNAHSKRRQIDLNVPIDIEEEEQEQPSTSDDPQFLIY